jgi:hypothetical protein
MSEGKEIIFGGPSVIRLRGRVTKVPEGRIERWVGILDTVLLDQK